jgi:hypothetical protein
VEWQKLVYSLAESGESPSDFAAKHGLNVRTLKWWRTQLKRGTSAKKVEMPSSGGRSSASAVAKAAEVRFARVGVEGTTAPASPKPRTMVRLEVGQVRIAVQSGCDRGTLATVLQVLGVREAR